MFRHVLTARSLFLTGSALVAFATLTASASAQLAFGRVANEPYPGKVTVINKIKTPAVSLDSANGKFLQVDPKIADALKNTDKLSKSPISGNRKLGISRGPITTVDLGPVIREAWQKARPKLTEDATKFLHERNIGGGFRTSRNNLTLAENGDLFVGWDGRGFTLKYVLRGNKLRTSIRVPGPSPASTDPSFTINFDVELTIDVDIAGTTLVAKPARVKLNVSRPTGANITGKLVTMVNDLVKFLAGPDFIGKGLAAINSQEFALNKPINLELAKLNPMLAKATKDVAIIPGYDKAKGAITLTLVNDTKGPIVK